MRNFVRSCFLYIWFIAVVSLLMMCLMWCVYLIPMELTRKNVANFYRIPLGNIVYHSAFSGSEIDTATDARMINMATMWRYDNAFQDALLNPRIHYTNRPEYSLFFALEKKQITDEKLANYPVTLSDFENGAGYAMEDIRIDLYPRFWHGWLIFLKPLLVFFNIDQIKLINLILQSGLSLAILYLMYKRMKKWEYCLVFIVALCFFNPLTTWKCLEYSIDFNVMLLATLWVLLNQNPNDKYLFFIIGTTTILFDFLTFPLITLGFPLITYICLYERSFKESVKSVVKNSLLWIVGYTSMMISKWILASCFTPYNILSHGWMQALHRIRSNVENGQIMTSITYHNTLLSNFYEFYYASTLYYLAFFAVGLFVIHLIKPYKLYYDKKLFVLLSIGLMPFVWYFILMQHAFVHHFFTHKTLVVFIYAILASIACCLKPKTN